MQLKCHWNKFEFVHEIVVEDVISKTNPNRWPVQTKHEIPTFTQQKRCSPRVQCARAIAPDCTKDREENWRQLGARASCATAESNGDVNRPWCAKQELQNKIVRLQRSRRKRQTPPPYTVQRRHATTYFIPQGLNVRALCPDNRRNNNIRTVQRISASSRHKHGRADLAPTKNNNNRNRKHARNARNNAVPQRTTTQHNDDGTKQKWSNVKHQIDVEVSAVQSKS